MALSTVNALLKQAALLNEGPDNAFTFLLTELPTHKNITTALLAEFGPGIHWRTKQPYTAADWHVKVESRGTDVENVLTPVLTKWIFSMPYSPSLGESRDWVKKQVIKHLCDEICETIQVSEVYEVFVSPPVWYEAHWQDFAFQTENQSWFLHLGVTD